MINFSYVLHPSCCGYYCLKHIIKRRKIKRERYMSLYDMKQIFVRNSYYCLCVKVKSLENIKNQCITLINNKNSRHYVIIKNINNKFVYLYDPLFLFTLKVKKDKFNEKWSKICLFYKKI